MLLQSGSRDGALSFSISPSHEWWEMPMMNTQASPNGMHCSLLPNRTTPFVALVALSHWPRHTMPRMNGNLECETTPQHHHSASLKREQGPVSPQRLRPHGRPRLSHLHGRWFIMLPPAVRFSLPFLRIRFSHDLVRLHPFFSVHFHFLLVVSIPPFSFPPFDILSFTTSGTVDRRPFRRLLAWTSSSKTLLKNHTIILE